MTSLRDNLFHLARSNDAPGIEKLIIRDSGELDERDDNGLTAIHICATYGCVEACATLLKLGAKHSLQDFESGWTPLHRAFYFGNLKISLLLIRAGALIADDAEKSNWKTDVFPRRERWRSIRNLSTWKPNIDHDGLSPLDLLSLSLGQNLMTSKRHLLCTSVLSFGKADFTLGVPLPNSIVDILRPRRIEPLSCECIIQIVASKYHSLALTRNGEVYSWGHGRVGRLGHGDENTQPEPKLISLLCGISVRMISAGENHTLAISSRGDLFSWGSDRFGQLGYGGSDAGKGSLVPKKIENLKKFTVVAIAAGEIHSVCFTDAGEIYSWGSNKEGQLGIPPLEMGAGIGGGPGLSVPRRVYIRGGKSTTKSRPDNKFRAATPHCPLLQIVASRCSTLLLCRSEDYVNSVKGARATAANEVYQWGHGSSYPNRVQFSRKVNLCSTVHGSKERDHLVDRFFSHVTAAVVNIVQLSAGLNHNVALSSIGHVYTWGLGSDQLGHGSHENRLSVPQLLETLLPENGGGRAVMVSAANDRTCVVSDIGDLYTWGATSEKGVLGLGSGSYQPIPKLVGGVKRAVSVAAGGDYTLVLTSATVPDMPFSDLALPNDSSTSGMRVNQSGKASKNNIVVVGGLFSKTDGLSRMPRQVSNGSIPEITSGLIDNDEGSDDESQDNDDDEGDAEEDVGEHHDHDEMTRGFLNVKNGGTCTPPGTYLNCTLSLQELCEKRICESVDTRNAIVLLAHAETVGARVLTAFCTQFIHSNLDAILVQSRLSDLDILIADLGFSDALGIGLRSTYSVSNSASSIINSISSSSSAHTGSATGSTLVSNIRHNQSRKLSKEDMEWHSKDTKYGVTRERSYSGSGDTGSFHKTFESPSVSGRTYSKEEIWNPWDDFGREDKGRSSQSRDLESIAAVMKMIRSVKKKIQSIDDLEHRLHDGTIKELNDEQKDKLRRKESIQSELKRLSLIRRRLDGEERIKMAAKAQRDKSALELEKEVSIPSVDSSPQNHNDLSSEAYPRNETELKKNSKATDTKRKIVHEGIMDPSLVMKASLPLFSSSSCFKPESTLIPFNSSKKAVEINCNENQSLTPSVSLSETSPFLSSSESESQQENSTKTRLSSSKLLTNTSLSISKSFNTPSFNDWLKVTEIGNAESTTSSIKLTQTTPQSIGKKVWDVVAATAVSQTTLSISNDFPTNPVNDQKNVKQIVSTEKLLFTTPTKITSSSSASAPRLSTINVTPAVQADKYLTIDRGKEFHSDRYSGEISLADLLISPKKRNNGRKNNEIVTTASVDINPSNSNKLMDTSMSKIVSQCPWLASPVLITSQNEKTVGKNDVTTTCTKIKLKIKTFNEIQVEEEVARLESNIHSLKGNHNPWYQERRKRADSIEAVIRSQAEEKIREEDRIDEENAIREVELMMKKEKRDKMKLEKSKQKAMLQAKHISHNSIIDGEKINSESKTFSSSRDKHKKVNDPNGIAVQRKEAGTKCEEKMTSVSQGNGRGRGRGRDSSKDTGSGRGSGRGSSRVMEGSIPIERPGPLQGPGKASKASTSSPSPVNSTLMATAAAFIPSTSGVSTSLVSTTSAPSFSKGFGIDKETT